MPSTTQRAWTSERPLISRAQRCTRNPPASLSCMLFATAPRAHTSESLIFFCPSAGARGRSHRVRELVALPPPLPSRVARRAPPRQPRVSSTPRVPVTLRAAAPGSGFVRAACAARRCAPSRSLAVPSAATAPRARSSARAGRPPCPRPAPNARRPAPAFVRSSTSPPPSQNARWSPPLPAARRRPENPTRKCSAARRRARRRTTATMWTARWETARARLRRGAAGLGAEAATGGEREKHLMY
jgi:hypothetical protein